MTKHRLMLSAAAAALLAAVSAARADIDITTNTSTALRTSTSGNIVIAPTGGVGITTASTAAVTINSANLVNNGGFIANTGTSDALGLGIDTTAGNIFSTTAGFISTGTIDLAGSGSGKKGIYVFGGKTFYAPITLTSLTASNVGAQITAQSSSVLIQGDASVAFHLAQDTKITSNVLFGGAGIIQNASQGSQQSNSVILFLDGQINGNVINSGGLSGTGPGLIGVQVNGGINSCASDAGKPAGFTCPAISGGSFVNSGAISIIGTATPSARGGNPAGGSAVIIASSIAGGFLNAGTGTSSNIPIALIAGNGLITGTVIQPVVMIDPSRSVTSLSLVPRGPAILGPVTSDIDAINPGYAFINRGAIQAQPQDAQFSTAAVLIQGASSTILSCLSASVGTCTGINANPQLNTGGFLNTGEITASAQTSVTNRTAGTVTASALYIGDFATIPRIDVLKQTVGGANTTVASITASVSGIGQGTSSAISISTNATVPAINIGRGATVQATAETNTTTPPRDVATASSPFSLVSQAIVDNSGTLKLINNAGSITAANTPLTPQSGTSVVNIQRAIDLSASTTGGTTVNNSGAILGDVLFSSAGNGNTLNIGNIGALGTANPATNVVNSPTYYASVGEAFTSRPLSGAPTTTASLINFGSGTGHRLHVGGYGYVNADIRSGVGSLDVQVDSNGELFIANTATSLQANNFVVGTNAILGLSIAQANLNSLTPVVQANSANLSGARLALQFGTFISSGFTAASVANPTVQSVTLIRAPVITDATLADQNALLGQNTPFLFETPAESGVQPLAIGTSGAQQTLELRLKPRSVNQFNADGSPGLNLSGDAKNQFPFVAAALSTDNDLGAAVATSMTVYNTPGVASSGINVLASQQQAEQVFSQFSPDVSGGTREIAILISDQATGPVAARQRLLRQYGKVAGEMTLWGEEFTGQINNKGRVGGSGTLTSYKDRGFGFALGVDGGSPRNGWYGGAFTFYTGDVSQLLPRTTKTNTQWFMLTGYTHWQGRKVFLDTQLSAGYGQFNTTRPLSVSGSTRIASSKRAGAMGAIGAKGGVMLKMLGIDTDPFISLDGMTMREEGYTESGGGPGFNLQVASYYASSMRTALGVDLKKSISLWGMDLTPGARLGYRYELLGQPVKIKAGFESTGGLGTAGNVLTFVGPDPDKGNILAGGSLGLGTDTWHLGVNYDWVRGSNGSTTQVGTISVLGRI